MIICIDWNMLGIYLMVFKLVCVQRQYSVAICCMCLGFKLWWHCFAAQTSTMLKVMPSQICSFLKNEIFHCSLRCDDIDLGLPEFVQYWCWSSGSLRCVCMCVSHIDGVSEAQAASVIRVGESRVTKWSGGWYRQTATSDCGKMRRARAMSQASRIVMRELWKSAFWGHCLNKTPVVCGFTKWSPFCSRHAQHCTTFCTGGWVAQDALGW